MAELKNYDSDTLLSGSSEDDLIINGEYFNRGGMNVTMVGGAGNDTLINSGSNSSLNGGDGDDSIINGYFYYQPWDRFYDDNSDGDATLESNNGSSVTINTGHGNDTVRNLGKNVVIQLEGGTKVIRNYGTADIIGSTANEYISLSGTGASTIDGGGGNDTVLGNYKTAEVFRYGGGNLRIENFNYDDMIELKSGSIKSSKTDGGDLIFKMSDDGSITLKNMANHAITIKDATGKTSTKIYGTGYSPVEVLKRFVQAINRSVIEEKPTLFDEAIQSCSNFGSIQEVIDKMIADCRAAGDGMKFLEDYCGIILNNSDTGAITGWDAGGLTAKTIDNVIPETLSAASLTSLTKATFQKYGLTVNYPQNESNLSDNQKRLLNGAYNWWLEESLKLIEESYGFKFDGQSINFYATDDESSSYWGLTSGNAASNSVSINLAHTTFEDEADLDGNSVDRCIAHELTHVLQNVFLTYFPQFLEEGMAELTGGIDDKRGTRIKNVASNADNLATYLNIENYSTGNANYYAAGYMFLRYMTKQIADAYDSLTAYSWSENVLLEGTAASELLTASGTGITINAGAGDDTITAYGSNEVLNGGAGDDFVYAAWDQNYRVFAFAANGGSDVVIGYNSTDSIKITDDSEYATLLNGSDFVVSIGSSRLTLQDAADELINIIGGDLINETIEKGEVSTLLTAASGDDAITLDGEVGQVYQYGIGAGNDTLYNFGASDSIQLYNGTLYGRSTIGNDVKLSVYDGSILLKGAGGKSINIVAGYEPEGIYNGIEKTVVAGTRAAEFISNHAKGVTVNAGAGNDTIYGGWQDSLSVIDGGSGNDLIIVSGGGETLDGGKGNDTLRADIASGNGRVFKFAENGGSDVVIGYTSEDLIRLTNATGVSTTKSGDDLILKVSTARMTLKDAVGKTLNILNSISNGNSSVKVSGTSFADSIKTSGANVTIAAGAGDDTITGSKYGDVFQFAYGSGNDVITNFDLNDTLRNTSGTMTYKKTGADYVVTIKKNATSSTITLKGAAEHFKLKKNGSVLTTDGIYYINNVDSDVKIAGTSGADSIKTSGANVTIAAGAGDDTITGSKYGDVFQFAYGSGNDVITNFDVNDTLKITSGTIKSYAASDSDYIIEVTKGAKTATVTLKNAADSLTLKKNGSVLTATEKHSSAELPTDAEDYWFEQDSDVAQSPLSEIVSTEQSVDLNFDPISEAIKPSALTFAAARKKTDKSSAVR